jgi:hypothetical protein
MMNIKNDSMDARETNLTFNNREYLSGKFSSVDGIAPDCEVSKKNRSTENRH